MSFTPGPWRTKCWETNAQHEVHAENGALICNTVRGGIAHDDQRDNALLIAASPELLATCRLVLSWLTCPKEELPPAATRKMVCDLEHAIKSATEEQPR